jgi:hypothetical protein
MIPAAATSESVRVDLPVCFVINGVDRGQGTKWVSLTKTKTAAAVAASADSLFISRPAPRTVVDVSDNTHVTDVELVVHERADVIDLRGGGVGKEGSG